METTLNEQTPEGWHQTFVTLWIGCFITGMGYSMTMPFLSLFIAELGDFTRFQINIYSGLAFAITFLSQAVISPYWGSLADQKGRKLMCLRASFVMSITIFLVGFATNVWVIILLRFLQGLFSGYISNATALMASETPHSRSGWVMTSMMTSGVTGNLVGPLLGGSLSDWFGYRIPFFITGILMFLTFLITFFLVHEHFSPIKKEELKTLKSIIAELPNVKIIVIMFFTTMFVQASVMSIDPIVSLYVKELMHGQGNISFVAGVVAATPGLGTLIASSKIGHTMDHIGPQKILIIGLAFAAALFVPMTFVSSPWALAFWRFILGLANAALLPAVQTILTLDSPADAFGRIFSYNQSFQAAGSVMGSLAGSTISGAFSYQAVFIVTGIMLLFNFILVIFNRTKSLS